MIGHYFTLPTANDSAAGQRKIGVFCRAAGRRKFGVLHAKPSLN
jgi:hypothetical protein